MTNRIGVLGLGKMGMNIALRLREKGYEVAAYNRSEWARVAAEEHGVHTFNSIRGLVDSLGENRVIWMMLTAGEATASAVGELRETLSAGDTVIDGSNSNYKEDIQHYDSLRDVGIAFLDAGCSGGPSGARAGMSITVGGDADSFSRVEWIFRELSLERGYAHVGPRGAGHFVKMVHNAIEYGMMQSMAEGFDLMENGPYKGLDLEGICKTWNSGSVISSNLMKLAGKVFEEDNGSMLSGIEPYVEDTGEGRWAAETAIEFGVPFTAITHSLYERFASRYRYKFGYRLLAALRNAFGGHEVKRKE